MNSMDRELIDKLRLFDRTHKKTLSAVAEKTGVYHSQHRMLMFISRNAGISQRELSKMLGISPAAVAGAVKALENEGFIKRTPVDLRTNSVFLTEKGENVVNESVSIFERIDKSIFADFSESEQEMLLFFLSKMIDNLHKYNENEQKGEKK